MKFILYCNLFYLAFAQFQHSDFMITTRLHGNVDNEIIFGNTIDCNTKLQPKSHKRLIVKHYNFPSACESLKPISNDEPSQLNDEDSYEIKIQPHLPQSYSSSSEDVEEEKPKKYLNTLYKNISSLGSSKIGNVVSFLKTKHFNVDLISLNGDFNSSTNYLLKKMNVYKTPTLYIILITRIKFESEYQEKLFEKILESNQILHILTLEELEKPLSVSHTVVTDEQILKGNVYSLTNFTYSIGTNEYHKSFNIIANEECNYPLCYIDCGKSNKIREEDYCLSLNPSRFTSSETVLRHFKFTFREGFRSRRELAPEWFLSWLQNRDKYVVDEALNPQSKRPRGVILVDESTVNSNGTIASDFDEFLKNLRIYKQNDFDTSLPLKDFANCYHGIVIDITERRKCLKYSVN